MNSNAVLSGALVTALLLTGCSILAPQGPTPDSRFQGVVVQNFEDRLVSLTVAVAGGDRSTQFQVDLPANDGDGFPPTEVVAPPTLINETGPITVRVGFNGTTTEQELSRPDNSPCYVTLVTVPIERAHSVPTRTHDANRTITPVQADSAESDTAQIGIVSSRNRCLTAAEYVGERRTSN